MRAPDQRMIRDNQVPSTAPEPVRKQKANLLRRNWLTGALLFVAAGALVYAGSLFYEAESKLEELERERQALTAQAANLKQRNADLKADISRLNDPKTVEQLAKQLLGMSYPNETVVRPMAAPTGTGR